MSVTSSQRQKLRGQAHSLNPVVIIGQHGLTEPVLLEIDRALEDHELIKVKVNAKDRLSRQGIIADIAEQRQAEIIQTIGHVAVFFRKSTRV
jgi:RNA-binding protein